MIYWLYNYAQLSWVTLIFYAGSQSMQGRQDCSTVILLMKASANSMLHLVQKSSIKSSWGTKTIHYTASCSGVDNRKKFYQGPANELNNNASTSFTLVSPACCH